VQLPRRSRAIPTAAAAPLAIPTLVLLMLVGCDNAPVDTQGPATDDSSAQDSAGVDSAVDDTAPTDDSATPARWAGEASVRVVDLTGAPIEGAQVMVGGDPPDTWQSTDSQGAATVTVRDDGISDRFLLAGKEGWTSAGTDIDEEEPPEGVVEIVLKPLPTLDNPAYHFQPGGTSASETTEFCGHCHLTIADSWSVSRHNGAARNTRTWDVYTGAAAAGGGATGDACDDLGGWITEGQEPGVEGGTVIRCSVSSGVLPFLHDDCGAPGQVACDHPDQRPSLTRFGACGDCHTPAQDAATPGAIDFAAATGIAHTEGVTCDLCHKIQAVTPGPAAGMDGGITLLRPSEDTNVIGQEFEPIIFGPYPDVIVPVMRGTYAPQFRDAAWCSSCHEYAQQALHPDQSVDAARWPNGVPVLETWTEYQAGGFEALGVTCQTCHMPSLPEESSTYDISEGGLLPSLDQGWLRAEGEIRDHTWTTELLPPTLDVDVRERDGEATVTVTVHNRFAGHAVPTGEPMRQLLVQVEARDSTGAALTPTAGRAVPDAGGFLAKGVVGVDVTVDGWRLDWASSEAISNISNRHSARFVRPTGGWHEDAGPGTAPWSDGALSGAARGLPQEVPLGEFAVAAADGPQVTLVDLPATLQTGDVVYLVEDDHLAGRPGWLYAKVLTSDGGERSVRPLPGHRHRQRQPHRAGRHRRERVPLRPADLGHGHPDRAPGSATLRRAHR
jgi:hypothetical protein